MTDIGTLNPTTSDDVKLTTAPRDANGLPTTPTLTWSASPGIFGSLVVAADTLSALFVTPAGDFAVVITVSTPEGVSDTATVSRIAAVTTVVGLAAELVPKA